MQMDPKEILRDYNSAADKKKQLLILAQLNSCNVDDIKDILRSQGVDYRSFPRSKSVKKQTSSPKVKNKKVPSDENSERLQKIDPASVLEYLEQLKARRNDLVKQVNDIDEELSRIKELCTVTGFSTCSNILKR